MEAVAVHPIAMIIKAIATLIALFSPAEQNNLRVVFVTAGETLVASEPVVFTADPAALSTPAYTMKLGAGDAELFYMLTRNHLGQELTILVCGHEVFSPVIGEAIAGGVVLINASFVNGMLESFVNHGCP